MKHTLLVPFRAIAQNRARVWNIFSGIETLNGRFCHMKTNVKVDDLSIKLKSTFDSIKFQRKSFYDVEARFN